VVACGSAGHSANSPDQPQSATGSPASSARQPASAGPFRPQFGDSGLVTNEYAYRHPDDPARRVSPSWIVTSGSLFASGGAGWTGVPDRKTPDARSSNGTDSAVFRLVSRRRNFGGVRVTFQLFVRRHVVGSGSERHDYDGVHVWLRYLSQEELYSLSVMRWDGQSVIKRKTPGGRSNGGTYRTLANGRSVLPIGRWVPITVEAINRSAGVKLTIIIRRRLVLRFIDSGPSALTQPGAIGIRGDNTQFKFRDLVASPIQN
jgi:hypothetical protein